MKPFPRKRHHAPLRAATTQPKTHQAAQSGKTREIFIGAAMALIGTLIGSFVTASIQQRNELIKRQVDGAVGAYRMDSAANTPQEFFDLKMMVDEMRTVTLMGSDLFDRLVALNRKYPGCQLAPQSFSTACQPYLIETTRAARVAAGGSEVSQEDMTLLLGPKIENARRAYQRLSGVEIPK